jgi:hypothetical protein
MELHEEFRTRISSEVASTIDVIETQFMEQASIFVRESEAQMAASHPSTQGSDFNDYSP